MITYTFDFHCEGDHVLGEFSGTCWKRLSEDVYRKPEDVQIAWKRARDRGWRLFNFKDERCHLCPACAPEFIKRKDKQNIERRK